MFFSFEINGLKITSSFIAIGTKWSRLSQLALAKFQAKIFETKLNNWRAENLGHLKTIQRPWLSALEQTRRVRLKKLAASPERQPNFILFDTAHVFYGNILITNWMKNTVKPFSNEMLLRARNFKTVFFV